MSVRCSRAARLRRLPKASAGFTLLELLVVLMLVGILSGIAAPGWFTFLAERQLGIAQERVHQSLRDAQSHAKLSQVTWQFSFRETPGTAQWAIHPATTQPADATWNNLDSSIQLDSDETTLSSSGGVRRVQFDRRGALSGGMLGRLTLVSKSGGKAKRCVFVSTLLGATRTGQNQPKPIDGKYCR